MKKLLILRHAKSSWEDASLVDFDRPLNERGERDAPFMGKILAERGITPDLIISSPAERAKRTVELVKEAAGWAVPVRFDERVYEASEHTLFSIVQGLSDTVSTCVLSGHNPGMEGIIRSLTGTSAEMPTASLAIIEFDVAAWSDVEPDCGSLVEVMRPKELS